MGGECVVVDGRVLGVRTVVVVEDVVKGSVVVVVVFGGIVRSHKFLVELLTTISRVVEVVDVVVIVVFGPAVEPENTPNKKSSSSVGLLPDPSMLISFTSVDS